MEKNGSKLRSIDLHQYIFNNPKKCIINPETDTSSFGLRKKSILFQIDSSDPIFGLTPELMHQVFLGIEKYNFLTSTSYKFRDYPSFISKQ